MTNFNFNGLTSPILPNIYISKIALDGNSSSLNKIAANRESAIEAHIDKRGPGMAGWTGNPKEQEYTSTPKLAVTYDLLLEVEELYDDLDDLVSGDIFKYIRVWVITFKGAKGKDAYKHLIGVPPLTLTPTNKFDEGPTGPLKIGELVAKHFHFEKPWPSEFGTEMDIDKDYKVESRTLDSFIEQSITPNEGNIDPKKHLSLKSKREIIKQKYKHIMPDGRTIYKIPVKIKQEIQGTIFPQNLSAIALCSLDLAAVFNDSGLNGQGYNFDINHEDMYGRIATEVIISNGKIPKQGMMFFISTDQITDEMGNSKFDNIMGTLWLGGVHKHQNRYMAGNHHDPDEEHPYLDYVLVDLHRVHDYRQITQVKKQILNFNFQPNVISGVPYINNQLSNKPSADFSNLACFGDLLSTINTKRQVKLSFCIDWGKLIKKHCLIPGLIDRLASIDENFGIPFALNSFFAQKGIPNILSFKVYRKRVDTPSDVVNDIKKKLIYDSYPNIYYTGQVGGSNTKSEKTVEYNPPVKSALSPLKLKYGGGDPGFKGYMGHYVFTDYDIENISRGTYEYSLEVEITDPTLSYFVGLYSSINTGINNLKPLVSFINGSTSPLHSSGAGKELFDPITGQLTQTSKDIFVQNGWNTIVEDLDSPVMRALQSLQSFYALSDNNFSLDIEKLKNLLILDTATPDSISLINEILISTADKIKSIVDSYSTASIPKIHSFSDSGVKEKSLQGKTIVATIPKKKIKVEHSFSKKTELVSTTHSDAGYDFFGGIPLIEGGDGLPNKTTANIGFKSVNLQDYKNRSTKEFGYYMPTLPAGETPLPLLIPGAHAVSINPFQSLGRYFKVPFGATHLPKYIVDHTSNNENDYWMVINNILRYKMGLYGDSGADHRLGYGPEDKIEGSSIINAQMERILKEYQTLAYRGIYFPQDSVVNDKSTVSATTTEKKHQGVPANGLLGESQTNWYDFIKNPLPGGTMLEKAKETLGSKTLIKKMQLPWAENYGQEKLLLSLINATFIAPAALDLKLGSFDTLLKGSKIEKYLSNMYNAALSSLGTDSSMLVDPFTGEEVDMGIQSTAATNVVATWIKNIPPHVLVLLANLHPSMSNLLQYQQDAEILGNFRYFDDGGSPQVYELPAKSGQINTGQGAGPIGGLKMLAISTREDIQNQDLKIDKFGQFWFNHMNLVEVQYLAGYEKTEKTPKPNDKHAKYEEIFNSSVKAPIWKPLSTIHAAQLLQSADKGQQYHLLCRIVKKKYDFFNTKAYEALGLPLYDEYFLITTKKQVGGPGVAVPGYNAYVKGFPDKNTPASAAGLQIVQTMLYDEVSGESQMIYETLGEEVEEVEVGEVDL